MFQILALNRPKIGWRQWRMPAVRSVLLRSSGVPTGVRELSVTSDQKMTSYGNFLLNQRD